MTLPRYLALFLLGLSSLLFALFLTTTSPVVKNLSKRIIASAEQQGFHVQFSNVQSLGLWAGVEFENLQVEDKSKLLKVSIPLARLRLSLWSLVSEEPVVTHINLDSPHIQIDHQFFYSPTSFDVTLLHVRMSDAWIDYINGQDAVAMRHLDLALDTDAKYSRIHTSGNAAIVSQHLMQPAHINISDLDFKIDRRELFSPSRIEFMRGIVSTDYAKVELQGVMELKNDTAMAPFLDLNIKGDTSLFGLANAVKWPIDMQGNVAAKGRLRASKDFSAWEFISETELSSVQINDMKFSHARALVVANPKKITLRNIEAEIGQGELSGQMDIQLTKNLPFQFAALVEESSLYYALDDFGIDYPPTDMQFNLQLHGSGTLSPFDLRGHMTGDAHDLVVKDGAIFKDISKTVLQTSGTLSLASDVHIDAEKLEFLDAEVTDQKSDIFASATLFFDAKKGILLDFHAPIFDLASINNHIDTVKFVGVGSIFGHLDGPYEDNSVQAQINVTDLQIADLHLGDVRGNIDYHGVEIRFHDVFANIDKSSYQVNGVVDISGPISIQLDASVEKAYAEHLRTIFSSPHERGIFAWIRDVPWSGPLSGKVHLEGPMSERLHESMTGNFELSILPQNTFYLQQGYGEVKGRLTEDFILVEKIHINLLDGVSDMMASYNRKTEEVAAHISFRNLSLPLARLPVKWAAFSGLFQGELKLHGHLNRIFGHGDIYLDNGAIGPLNLGSIHVPITVDKNQITAPIVLRGKQVSANLSCTANAQIPCVLDANINIPTTRSWFTSAFSSKWDMALVSRVHLYGNLFDLQNWEGALDVASWKLLRGDTSLAMKQPITIGIQAGQANFPSLDIVTKHRDQFQLSGSVGLEKSNLEIKAKTGLWFLPLVYREVDVADGELEVAAMIEGPIFEPFWHGSAHIRDGFVSFRRINPGIRNLNAKIVLERRDIQVRRMTFDMGKGKISAKGQANFVKLRPENYEFDVWFNHAPFDYMSQISAVADGKLRSFKKGDLSWLTGEVNILKAQVKKDFDFNTALKWKIDFPHQQLVADPQTRLNIRVATKESIRVRNQNMVLDVGGNLILIGDVARPSLMGTVVLHSGELTFRHNRYRILQGRADFTSAFNIIPWIEIQAESKISDYNIGIRLFGSADKPKMQLSSRPFLPQPDVLSLMMFGFVRDDVKNALGSASYAGLEALSTYAQVDRALLALLPDQIKHSDMTKLDELRITSVFSMHEGMQLPAVMMGMDIFNGMRLRMLSTLVKNNAGTLEKKLELEHNLNERLKWRAVWNSQGTSSLGDGGADVFYRWEFR